MELADVHARALAMELRESREALAAVLKEIQAMRTERKRDADVLNATRRELSELRVKKPEGTAHDAITRLVQRVAYQPPVAKFGKEIADHTRVFLRGRESLNGRVQHVIVARDSSGNLIELPCSYDYARRFIGMPEPNRRKHWKGHRAIYGAMLRLCESAGLIERAGRRFRWCERYGLAERAEWVRQFAPPHRIR